MRGLIALLLAMLLTLHVAVVVTVGFVVVRLLDSMPPEVRTELVGWLRGG